MVVKSMELPVTLYSYMAFRDKKMMYKSVILRQFPVDTNGKAIGWVCKKN